jgi:hypothetical protein
LAVAVMAEFCRVCVYSGDAAVVMGLSIPAIGRH